MSNSLSEIKAMSRSQMESLRDEVNAEYVRLGVPQIPFSVFVALVNAKTFELPISNGVFCIMLKHAFTPIGNAKFISLWPTPWLDDERIKGCVMFTHSNINYIYFITQEQLSLMALAKQKAIAPTTTAEEFYNFMNNEIDKLTIEPITADEETIPLMGGYHIDTNSDSIEIWEKTSRFSGATWFEAIQEKVIVLAGLGGIGSYVCFLLARMQPKAIFMYDDDIVEVANMSGQLYCMANIGDYKVDAMSDMVCSYANYNGVCAIREKYTNDSEAADIMLCGFDNMVARETYFRKWLSHVTSKSDEERKNCLFIDGRLSAEYFQVFCITGDDNQAIEEYQSNRLFSDEEADETVCSYKQTTYMANMIGSVIVNLFTNFVANEVAGAPIRELPYFTSYDGCSMQFKIE